MTQNVNPDIKAAKPGIDMIGVTDAVAQVAAEMGVEIDETQYTEFMGFVCDVAVNNQEVAIACLSWIMGQRDAS